MLLADWNLFLRPTNVEHNLARNASFDLYFPITVTLCTCCVRLLKFLYEFMIKCDENVE